jgi:hypothetical protein
MSVLARLHFTCSSRASADAIIVQHALELERERLGTVLEVTVRTCCAGEKTVQVVPTWRRGRAGAALAALLSIQPTVEQRGGLHLLTLEISDPSVEAARARIR